MLKGSLHQTPEMTRIYKILAIIFLEIILKKSPMNISNRRTQANRQNALQSTAADKLPRIFKDCA